MNIQNERAFFLLGTTVTSSEDVLKVENSLNYLVGKSRWNFDLEDCDRVLRLRCSKEVKEDVIHYLKLNGVFKFELHYLDTEIEKQVHYSVASLYDLIA